MVYVTGVARRQEMLTPRAPDLTLVGGFTLAIELTFLPIVTLLPILSVSCVSDLWLLAFGHCSFLEYSIAFLT
jgi:hypothetical protein